MLSYCFYSVRRLVVVAVEELGRLVVVLDVRLVANPARLAADPRLPRIVARFLSRQLHGRSVLSIFVHVRF